MGEVTGRNVSNNGLRARQRATEPAIPAPDGYRQGPTPTQRMQHGKQLFAVLHSGASHADDYQQTGTPLGVVEGIPVGATAEPW